MISLRYILHCGLHPPAPEHALKRHLEFGRFLEPVAERDAPVPFIVTTHHHALVSGVRPAGKSDPGPLPEVQATPLALALTYRHSIGVKLGGE